MTKETVMNPVTESKLVRPPTRCKICGHIFKSDLLGEAAILGGNPAAKLQQVQAMTKPLIKHLEKSHPDVIYNAQLTGGEFAGYLTMLAFECDDETLQKMGSDFTRWNVHRLTARKAAIPDDLRIGERLTALLSKHGIRISTDPESPTIPVSFAKELRNMLCEMRDSIIEKDRYVAQPASEKENGKRN